MRAQQGVNFPRKTAKMIGPAVELVDQSAETIQTILKDHNLGLPIGVISEHRKDLRVSIIVATHQSLTPSRLAEVIASPAWPTASQQSILVVGPQNITTVPGKAPPTLEASS